jgi:hypothetical protein
VNLNAGSDARISLSGVIEVFGQSLAFDFGDQGIGGFRDSPVGNGRYELALDLNNDGLFQDAEKLEFFRLYGDATGDALVDFDDYMLVRNQYGRIGDNLDADMNGDGRVNFTDIRAVYGQFGARL